MTSELELSLSAYEAACLRRALEESAGNVQEAAAKLRLSKSTMYRLISKHGIGTVRMSRAQRMRQQMMRKIALIERDLLDRLD